jgi:hypothetical protein
MTTVPLCRKRTTKFQGFAEKRKHFHTKLTATSQSDEVFAQQWQYSIR